MIHRFAPRDGAGALSRMWATLAGLARLSILVGPFVAAPAVAKNDVRPTGTELVGYEVRTPPRGAILDTNYSLVTTVSSLQEACAAAQAQFMQIPAVIYSCSENNIANLYYGPSAGNKELTPQPSPRWYTSVKYYTKYLFYATEDWAFPIVTRPICPSNATASTTIWGSGCTCNEGYIPAPFNSSLPTECRPVFDANSPQEPPRSCGAAVGNPIYPMTGAKREVADTGLSIGPLRIRLTYDSTPRVIAGRVIDPNPGVLGALWHSSLHRRIFKQYNAMGALASRGNGYTISFTGDSHGNYTAAADNPDRLITLPGGGYRYFDAAEQAYETYDAQGKLGSISWSRGDSVVFGYSDANTPASVAPGPDYLIQARDDRGRTLDLYYDAKGHLSQFVSAAGQAIVLGFDIRDNLEQLTWADGKTRKYLYGNPDMVWALTGVTDERAIRKSTFQYDSSGRAISTEYAGAVNKFSVSYSTPPAVAIDSQYDSANQLTTRSYAWVKPQGTTISAPLAVTTSVDTTTINGKTYLTSQSQPAGSGCAASTSSQGFDANGNLSQRDDFNGTRTCYANDTARNLETARVEGLSPSVSCASVTPTNASLPVKSRKISTQWHPDWRLTTSVAEPGKLTTSVYNGQPDPFAGNAIASCAPASAVLPDGKPIAVLCKQVEQATTDADGQLGFSATLQSGVPNRQITYTYNASGQVLTAKGPRTDIDDTVTYVYYTDTTADHTVGDLESITDAVGLTTRYTRYDKLGQVLQSTDANGVATVNTYDLRQRLLTTTVAGKTTTYTYDEAGLLKRVTLPDTSWIGYDYDDAQRQVAVYDNKGNRTDYTLDNAGNRIAEKTQDVAGNLKRQLSRSIDALGRIQQTTGRE